MSADHCDAKSWVHTTWLCLYTKALSGQHMCGMYPSQTAGSTQLMACCLNIVPSLLDAVCYSIYRAGMVLPYKQTAFCCDVHML